MELDKNQINRLYMVFDFDEDEEIEMATFEHNRLKIHYSDKDDIIGCYEPDLDLHNQEDINKLNFIMNGLEIKRD